jgi:flagellar export protein FliJ
MMAGREKRSERMGRVADLAREDERTAASKLADARRAVDETRGRLVDLKRFHCDYAERAKGSGPAGDIASLRNHRAFLAQLAASIESETARLGEIEKDYLDSREAWLSERARARALSKVADKHRADEARRVERRESLEQDERAQRVSRRSILDSD